MKKLALLGWFLSFVVAVPSSWAIGPAVGASCTVSWDAVTTNTDGSPTTSAITYNLYLATVATPPVPGTRAPAISGIVGTSVQPCGALAAGQWFGWVTAVEEFPGGPSESVVSALTPFVLVGPTSPANVIPTPPANVINNASGAQQSINVALQANGGAAWAEHMYSSGYPPSAVNDGDRKGVNPGVGGYWNDATPNTFPDWIQVNFNGLKTITEIDIFTLQDDYLNPVDPTPSMTFSAYGITEFNVFYWTGAEWAFVPWGSITGNNLVWRRLTFPPITTDRIGVLVNRAADQLWTRIVEIEAWGN